MPTRIALILICLIGVLALLPLLVRLFGMSREEARPWQRGGGAKPPQAQPRLRRGEALAIAESTDPPPWVSPVARRNLAFIRRTRTAAMIGVFVVSVLVWMVVFHVLVDVFPAIDEVSNPARLGLGVLTWVVLGVLWCFFIRSLMAGLVRHEYERIFGTGLIEGAPGDHRGPASTGQR